VLEGRSVAIRSPHTKTKRIGQRHSDLDHSGFTFLMVSFYTGLAAVGWR
jgi:hypothetical protein